MPLQTRMTQQRKVILEELRKVTSHPTADEIYEMVRPILPRISLGTVYRNLDLLAETGKILRLEHAGAQKRFDGNPAPHQHVRCTKCGRVADIPTPVEVPTFRHLEVAEFALTAARLEFEGICSRCMPAN